MTQDLQPLIEQIRQEGIDKAEAEAEDILAKARKKAAAIVKEAEDKKRAMLEEAQNNARIYEERSRKNLEHAGRDLLITVRQAIERIQSDLVVETVDQAMGIEVIKEMLVKMAEQCAAHSGESRMEILVSPEDHQTLIKTFADLYRQKMISGLNLKADNDVLKGFKVSFKDDHVYLDFTNEAVAEALSQLLRPHLSEIVKQVAAEKPTLEQVCSDFQDSYSRQDTSSS
jgi:V/A-type H+-transporting ATPase subunit E